MENAPKTPPKTTIQSETVHLDSETPTHNQQFDQKFQNSGNDSCIAGSTPNRLKVPKAFKHPERYRSPTDLMMSPVSKGLLALSRKPGPSMLLPPSKNQPKVLTAKTQSQSHLLDSGFDFSGGGSFPNLKNEKSFDSPCQCFLI